jgi:hypothetical protein
MKWSGAIAAATFLMLACGHMEATPRLKEAQAAYGKAAQGPAAQYSPAELATAKKALDQANASLETGDRDLVDDKASLALSKVLPRGVRRPDPAGRGSARRRAEGAQHHP